MRKKTKKRMVWIGIAVVVLIIIVVIAASSGKKGDEGPRTVKVERRDIIDKALAVGSIEPVNEIAVKSKISGVVGEMYVGVGDFIVKGEPLLDILPNPTPLELMETKRNVEMKKIALETLARELKRNEELKEKNLISDYDFEVLRQEYDEALLSHKIAEEQLDLLEKGKVKMEDKDIETVIKSPITGFILEKSVNMGDPVVPLTSYQAGTELMKMANMENLLFKGTVDEIDVGKISEGLTAELQIGALPGKKVIGHVTLISLKARKEDDTTVFPVEIVIDETQGAVLRAGFSANANIIIAQKDSVLSIPERVVTFRNDSTFVRIPTGEEKSEEISIQTGLSDAITIEVISGLEEDQEVLEKEIKEII
jgi:HlyD family secretion protein